MKQEYLEMVRYKKLDEKTLDGIAKMMYEEWGETPEYWKDDVLKYVDENVRKGNGEHVVIFSEGKPIGYVSAFSIPYNEKDNITYLYYLIVDKDHRKNGIGSYLMNEVKYYAKYKMNSKYIFMCTDSNKVFDFNVKNGIKVVEDLVLTLPDEPLGYLMVYTLDPNQEKIKSGDKEYEVIDGKELKQIVKSIIETIYYEDELRDYKGFFDLTYKQIDPNMKYILSDNKFIPDNTYDRELKDSELPNRDIKEVEWEVDRIKRRFNRIFYL